MNKILYNRIGLLLFLMAVTFMVLPACKKDAVSGPVITGVRNYAVAPGDSVLQSLLPGQRVVLLGHNLGSAVRITFNGIPAEFNSALFSDTSAVVQVPAVIPFPSVPADQLNTIVYVSTEGSTTFNFNIVAPPPTITGISNENANAGDSVYVYGLNFFFIEQLTFAGTPVTAFKGSEDGTAVGFVLPSLTQGGPVVITTKSGRASTVYNVNDPTTGVLCNFDNVNTFSWGCNVENSSANFPGNKGNYAVLNSGVLSANEGSWWNGGRSINTNNVQWLPVGNLNDPLGNYALKFEMNVPNEWNGTSVFIVKDYNWDYLARFEPWKDANGAAFSFTTRGWRTVTIPLSMFRKDRGKAASAASLTALLGSSGNGAINFFTINDNSSSTPTGFTIAVDNIRLVKVN